jgi:hypothetical protein
MIVSGEVVAIRRHNPSLLHIDAGNAHDALVVPVSFKQFGAIAKEGMRWHAIVFEDNALFLMLKKPVQGAADRKSAPEVSIPK